MPPPVNEVNGSIHATGAVLLGEQGSTINATDASTEALQVDSTGRLLLVDSSGNVMGVYVGANPSSAFEGTNLAYSLVKATSVLCATTGNVTLAGGAPNVVDGITLAVGARVLVWQQTSIAQNGIYTVTTLGTGANGTWARAADSDDTIDFQGQIVLVRQGLLQAGNVYDCYAAPATVGTNSVGYALRISGDGALRTRLLFSNAGGITPNSGQYAAQVLTFISDTFAVVDDSGDPLCLVGSRQGLGPAIETLGSGTSGYAWLDGSQGALGNTTGVAAGSDLFRITGSGVDSGGVLRTARAAIALVAEAAFTGNTATPTAIALRTVPAGASTPVDRLTVSSTGLIKATRSNKVLDTDYYYESRTLVTRNNTVLEQDLINTVFTIADFNAGDRIRWHLAGDALFNSGAPTVQFAIRFGAQNLTMVAATPGINAQRRGWVADFYITFVDAIDSSCVVAFDGTIMMSNSGAADIVLQATSLTWVIESRKTAVDMSTDPTFRFTTTMSVASTSNEVRCNEAFAQRLAL